MTDTDLGVISIADRLKPAQRSSNRRDRALKLRAMHLVSQLPEDPAEARRILAYAMEIVDQFMSEGA